MTIEDSGERDQEQSEAKSSNEGANSSTLNESASGRTQSSQNARPGRSDEGEGRQSSRRDRKRFFKSAKELLTDEVYLRARDASPRLKECLAGTVMIDVRDRGERYVLEWAEQGPKLAASEAASADCVIHLNESNLLKIASGDLNPQVGMLSDKIFVEGKLSLAVYFFNLVAPVVA